MNRYEAFEDLPDLCRGSCADLTPTITEEKTLDSAPLLGGTRRAVESTRTQKENQ